MQPSSMLCSLPVMQRSVFGENRSNEGSSNQGNYSQPSLVDIDSSIYALTMASDSDIAGFTTHFLRPIKMFLKTRPTVVISNDCARVTNKSTVGESFGVLTFLSFESRMKMQFFRASEPWEHRTAVAGGTWWQAQ